jgi:hypothetical protein
MVSTDGIQKQFFGTRGKDMVLIEPSNNEQREGNNRGKETLNDGKGRYQIG